MERAMGGKARDKVRIRSLIYVCRYFCDLRRRCFSDEVSLLTEI